jgi:DNA-binding transcriptional regulator YiaG
MKHEDFKLAVVPFLRECQEMNEWLDCPTFETLARRVLNCDPHVTFIDRRILSSSVVEIRQALGMTRKDFSTAVAAAGHFTCLPGDIRQWEIGKSTPDIEETTALIRLVCDALAAAKAEIKELKRK